MLKWFFDSAFGMWFIVCLLAGVFAAISAFMSPLVAGFVMGGGLFVVGVAVWFGGVLMSDKGL